MSRALLFPLGGGGSSTQATTKKLAFFRSGSSSLSFKAFHSFNCKRNLIFPPISTSFSCRLSTAGDKQEDQVAVSSSSSNNNNNNKLLHRNINNINNDLLDNTGHEQQYNNKEILKRLYEISRPERYLIIGSAATLAVTSSITLLLPYACGHVLDAAMESATSASDLDPFQVSLGLFGLTCTAGIGVGLRQYWLNIAGNRLVSRMRRQLFASILSQESAFFDQNKSGDLISRIANDAYFIKSAVTTEAVAGLRGVVMSVGSTSLLFYTSPTLAIISLLSIPPVFLAARIVGRRLKKNQKQVQELHGKATNVAEEVLGGIKTVQLFNAEMMEYNRYSEAVNAAHDKEIQVGKTKALFDGVVHVAANGAVLLVLGYGGKLVLRNEMTAGDLTGFLMYSLLMAGNLSSLSSTYAEVIKSIAAAGRSFDIIDRVPQIPSSFRHGRDNSDGNVGSYKVSGRSDRHTEAVSISFRGVLFAYPARQDVPVLGPNFSLDIKAGENIALVGGSGSGKSTVSLLLARLYELNSGSIYINGQNIESIDPERLREQIGVVSQESFLFDGTIFDNIRYGRSSASDEEVMEAATAAHVTHFTDDLPLGLATQVGPRGTQLRLV
jgi:ATP-binding cassette subfamily B protein